MSHLTLEKFAFVKVWMMILSGDQLISLTRINQNAINQFKYPPCFIKINFQKMHGLFNLSVKKQYSPLRNKSKLPSRILYSTNKRLSTNALLSSKFEIIRKSDPSKDLLPMEDLNSAKSSNSKTNTSMHFWGMG